jgi:hypothetical protein
MTTRIKLRRDTAANWTTNNPILAAGEPGLETDTGKVKHGDGTLNWSNLEYSSAYVKPRDVVGGFLLHGPVPNDTPPSGQDWWFESVVADPNGGAYYLGGDTEYDHGTGRGHVVKVDVNGDIVWAKEITWADGYEGAGISGIYNTATDQLVLTAQWWKNTPGPEYDDTVAVIKMNPTTGALIGDVVTIRDDNIADGSDYGYLYVYDIALTNSGDPIVIGSKTGNLTVYAVTTQTGSTQDIAFVDATVFPAGEYPVPYYNWYITGTNIVNKLYITGVNQYNNIPTFGIASTGTGATFTVSSDGAGGYTLDAVTAGGSNYFVRNKILVLGSALGGADTVNDATITITAVTTGSVTAASITGLSTGGAQFIGVTGTNIASGSNLLLSTVWRMKGSDVYFPSYQDHVGFWLQQQGSGYAVNDTVYINPGDYGGLTSATVTVTAVGGSGEVTDFAFTGTFNTSTIKLYSGSSVNFGTTGTWYVRHEEQQSFIWTPTWNRLFGDTAWDNAQAVDTDSNGNIYIAGNTYDLSVLNYRTRGILVKVDSSGNLIWAKNFDPVNFNDFDNGYTGVVVDSQDNIIVCHDKIITKVNSSGTVLWQKWIARGDPLDMWNACVKVDSDNNVYVAAEYDYMGNNTGDDFLIVKFDTHGNTIWQRDAGTTADEDSNWNNGYQILSVQGDRFYLAGNSYQGSDDVGFGLNFPTDGTGASDDHIGRFHYRAVNWNVTTSTATVQTMAIFWTTATSLTVSTTSSFTAANSTVSNTSVSIRSGETNGRIENLYSLGFEDGSVQKTAYKPGYPQGYDSPRIYNTDDYYLNLDDAGRMTRWVAENWAWGVSVYIYVPTNSSVPFEIGTRIHFMKDKGFKSLMFWPENNSVTIMPANPAEYMIGNQYDSGEGWSVRHPNYTQIPCIATLTKVDINRWLLSCDSPVHIMDWSW